MADLRKDVRGAIAGQRDRSKAEDLDTRARPQGRQVRAPESSGTELLWNLSDDPNVAGGSQARNIPVGGSTLRPGQALQAPAGTTAGNAKLKALVESGMLFQGPKPPESYLLAKNKIRVKAPRGAALRPGKQGGLVRQVAEAEGEHAQALVELDAISREQGRIKAILERNKADANYCRTWHAKLAELEPKAERCLVVAHAAEGKLRSLRAELAESMPVVPEATAKRLATKPAPTVETAVESDDSSGRRSSRRSRNSD